MDGGKLGRPLLARVEPAEQVLVLGVEQAAQGIVRTPSVQLGRQRLDLYLPKPIRGGVRGRETRCERGDGEGGHEEAKLQRAAEGGQAGLHVLNAGVSRQGRYGADLLTEPRQCVTCCTAKPAPARPCVRRWGPTVGRAEARLWPAASLRLARTRLPCDIGRGDRRWAKPSPTRSGPKGSSRNEFRFGSPFGLHLQWPFCGCCARPRAQSALSSIGFELSCGATNTALP